MTYPIAGHGQRYTTTAADTDGGGVTATKAAVTGKANYVTDISASGDAAALVTVVDGTTVIWRQRLSAAFAFAYVFETPLQATKAAAVTLVVSAATTNSEANFGGFTI